MKDNDPLRDLGAKIESAKHNSVDKPNVEDHHSGLQHGWRMVIELVTGLAVGFGLGYGLDIALGTLPIFMVIFTLLGFVAGIRTMLSTAKEVQRNQELRLSEKNERDI